MGALQPWHLILIVLLALILFGAGKLADAGGALGKSVKEFRQAVKDPAVENPAAPQNASAGRSCPQCGTRASDSDKFCSACGTPLAPRQIA